MDIFSCLFSRGYKLLFLLDILLEGLSHWYCWGNNSNKNKRLQKNNEQKEHL